MNISVRKPNAADVAFAVETVQQEQDRIAALSQIIGRLTGMSQEAIDDLDMDELNELAARVFDQIEAVARHTPTAKIIAKLSSSRKTIARSTAACTAGRSTSPGGQARSCRASLPAPGLQLS